MVCGCGKSSRNARGVPGGKRFQIPAEFLFISVLSHFCHVFAKLCGPVRLEPAGG
jgi:hypothetical protein